MSYSLTLCQYIILKKKKTKDLDENNKTTKLHLVIAGNLKGNQHCHTTGSHTSRAQIPLHW